MVKRRGISGSVLGFVTILGTIILIFFAIRFGTFSRVITAVRKGEV